MFKNVASQKVAVFAWDNAAGAAKTGDAGNISAQISIDCGVTAATNDAAPTELDAADAPGIYYFNTLQAETNGDLIIISPVSSTADVVLRPVIIYTQTVMRGTDSAATEAKQDIMDTNIAAIPTVAAILAGIVEGTYDLKEVLRLILSFVAGKSTGGGTAAIVFRDTGDTKNRIAMTVDSNGNRSAVTLDES